MQWWIQECDVAQSVADADLKSSLHVPFWIQADCVIYPMLVEAPMYDHTSLSPYIVVSPPHP